MQWEQARDILAAAGNGPDVAINMFETALALALFDVCEPGEGLSMARCRDTMAAMVDDLRHHPQARSPHLHDRLVALRHVFVHQYEFRGDNTDYDNPENANMARVMERRRGLPVALGILCLHLADQMGWDMHGLNFPNHFLLRLATEQHRAIIDPFNSLTERAPGELRMMIKAHRGKESEMHPDYFEAVGKKSVLLRLQNNIKVRMIQNGELETAVKILVSMRLLAPREPELLREQAVLNLSLGKFRDSIAALEQSLGLDLSADLRAETAALLEELKRKLN